MSTPSDPRLELQDASVLAETVSHLISSAKALDGAAAATDDEIRSREYARAAEERRRLVANVSEWLERRDMAAPTKPSLGARIQEGVMTLGAVHGAAEPTARRTVGAADAALLKRLDDLLVQAELSPEARALLERTREGAARSAV